MNTIEQLKLYVEAINQIDDYFEYRYESKKDREQVYRIIDELTCKLAEDEK